jgi:hypothetical protein
MSGIIVQQNEVRAPEPALEIPMVRCWPRRLIALMLQHQTHELQRIDVVIDD